MTRIPVGQLLCVGIRGAVPGDTQLEQDLEACATAGVGGVILFDVDVPTLLRLTGKGMDREAALMAAPRNIAWPGQVADLIAHVRRQLGPDVLVTVDQEGGQVARLNRRRGFDPGPSAVEFAALDAAAQAAAAGRQAALLHSLGVDLNFAPCVDLALEPANEIVVGSRRSFGDDPAPVIRCARVVLDAHAAAGVGACLKHFPGHGSSRGDTHQGAVDITGTWQREVELAPYRDLVHRPGMAVMVAHVMHRGLDPVNPASLSRVMIDGILRGELGFDGVVVTDSIDMRAITGRWTPEQAAVTAVSAGADLVVDGFNLLDDRAHPAPALAQALNDALDRGDLPEARITESCGRLARLKTQIRETGAP